MTAGSMDNMFLCEQIHGTIVSPRWHMAISVLWRGGAPRWSQELHGFHAARMLQPHDAQQGSFSRTLEPQASARVAGQL